MTGTFIERRAPSPAPGVLFAVIPISSLLPLPHKRAASFCLTFCYRLNCAPEKLNAVLTAQDRGAWRAAVRGIEKSRTRLSG